jgi:hypothetical protein
MELLGAAVAELEAERNDIESVDPTKMRNLLKEASNSKLDAEEAITLKQLGLRMWNTCVRLSQAHSTFTLLNVKVFPIFVGFLSRLMLSFVS